MKWLKEQLRSDVHFPLWIYLIGVVVYGVVEYMCGYISGRCEEMIDEEDSLQAKVGLAWINGWVKALTGKTYAEQ